MRSIKIYILFVLLGLSGMTQAQDELNHYLVEAAENNPALKASFNKYLAALEKGPQVGTLPDPQLAFAYFIQPVETRNGPQEFKLSATQMFPWFGTLKAKESAAIEEAKALYEVFEETKSKLFNEVKANWYNLYFNSKATNITLENIDILNTFKKLAIVKVEAGLVSAVDQYRIEMEIHDLENQLALLRDKQDVLEVTFNNLLNSKDKKTITFPSELWTTDILYTKEAILDSIQMKNHQLLSIDLQKSALAFKKQVARKQGAPSFSLGIDYVSIGKGENNLSGKDAVAFPMVGLTIPLYRNKYKSMVQEVIYLEAAKDYERVDKVNVLETIFENSWKDYRDAHRRIDLFERQLRIARISLKLLETEYAYANKNFEEILRMERRLLKYNLELEKARADKQAAIAFIHYLMGK
ncbi:TolC family protein [Carboxylicivirga mesophila]|uniref:TolC family protein n=1 Tax=Carboxylicivirga mesophila TaxID=1166478 RepID=A0ABS5KC97_9BACT|nr:TolC family protein [Carboxylicivirga mesophila]MBS2212660.1 TolC family protein [Carboxylicivirga mesophila]